MDNKTMTGLDGAITRIQPQFLPKEAYEPLKADAVAAVLATCPASYEAARIKLSFLTTFLADVLPRQPGASLTEVLTAQAIDGYADRLARLGVNAGSVSNRIGALRQILAAVQGLPLATRGAGPSARRIGYLPAALRNALALAVVDESSGAIAFIRVVSCEMAGVAAPERDSRRVVSIGLDGSGQVRVGASSSNVWASPVPLPPSVVGGLGATDLKIAAGWARDHGGIVLDRGRLRVNRLSELLRTETAVTVLRMNGLGHKTLEAALEAIPVALAPEIRRALRG